MTQGDIRQALEDGRRAYRQGHSELRGLEEGALVMQFGMLLEALRQRGPIHPVLITEMEWVRKQQLEETDTSEEEVLHFRI